MSLLELPPELREQIYLNAFSVPATGNHLSTNNLVSTPIYESPYAEQPALARTCKRLRLESLPAFYSTSTFMLPILNEHSVRAALRWIETTRSYWSSTTGLKLKVYSAFDGRSIPYENFRWHARGPYWLRLTLRRKDREIFPPAANGTADSDLLYVRGVTELNPLVAKLCRAKADSWLVTAVGMLLAVIGDRASQADMDLFVDVAD